ncbi:MAG: transcriptional regulator [Candidatus Terraquivivens tikiterensis]|uniref:Transcriptional regulator n=1 Tax=Candidatus Terraquivivens tikiterensis TaxID=1980982 RepID=A0A2R7Y9D1_9ARCH|nr:MAG: transcriptional regulator [Candidatus Terraquivivens tikiterensis]
MVRISNLELLKILREDARKPFLEIAKLLGVSETAVRKRVRKLEESGIIRKYTVEVDPKKIGFNINVLIGIDTVPERFISALERLKDMEEVVSLYSSSGDHMILAECWFRSSKELSDFVRKLESIDGVIRVCPAIILEKVK